MRVPVEVYLACALNAAGGIGKNIIPPGSAYSGGGTYTIAIQTSTTYIITWGANDTSATVGSTSYPTTGAGTQTIFYSGGNTVITFTGTGGSTVTARLRVGVKQIPIPSGFTWTLNAAGTQVTASWDAPPSQVTNTQVYTSTNGTSYSVAATVNAPGTSATMAAPAVGSTLYCKLAWANASGVGPFSAALSVPTAQVSGWAGRVVAHGGASPSAATVSAANTFVSSLLSTTVWSKLICVNFVAPDSIIACQTPLVVGPGIDPWTNNPTAMMSGSLSVTGWFDTYGSNTSAFNTGIVPSSVWSATSGGFSYYLSVENAVNTLIDCGSGESVAANRVGMYHAYSGVSPNSQTSYMYDTSHGTSAQDGHWAGFFSANRTSATSHIDYSASSTRPFGALGSDAAVCTGCVVAHPFAFGGFNNNGTYGHSGKTYSFFAMHQGLSSSEVQTLYNAVQALRVALGGGYV